ncbi:MAG: hypothetical protein ACTS2F_14880 [Thainema sp.]
MQIVAFEQICFLVPMNKATKNAIAPIKGCDRTISSFTKSKAVVANAATI